jgi:L-fucose isomerase-like protein
MKITEKKITFGLIVGTRGFFNSALAAQGRKDLVRLLEKLGYGYVILPEDATPTGAIETLEDARRCARLFNEKREEIDGIIISLPNFGDELGIINTLKFAKMDVPVMVQACDDDIDKVSISQRRDAFCGKLSVCNNLYQYAIPFTNTTMHTCKILSDVFEQDVHRFAAVCRVTRGLKNARIGAIGTRPAAFQTMRVSEKMLQMSGITVIPVDMSDILAVAEKVKDDDPRLIEN